MRTRMTLAGALMAAALLIGTGSNSWARSSHSASHAPDAAFMREAAQGGMTEVRLGRLAAEKAVDADVRAFGQRMVDDHSKANQELKQLARGKGAALPSSIGSKNQKTYNSLSHLSGAAFDKAYMRDMVKDHEADVAAFRRESQSAKDPSVKEWAAKTLPTLEDHLRMARGTAAKLGAVSGRMSMPSGHHAGAAR